MKRLPSPETCFTGQEVAWLTFGRHHVSGCHSTCLHSGESPKGCMVNNIDRLQNI